MHGNVTSDSFLFNFDNLEDIPSCEIICPLCKDKILLSSYIKTSAKENLLPMCFRAYHFERHMTLIHGKGGKRISFTLNQTFKPVLSICSMLPVYPMNCESRASVEDVGAIREERDTLRETIDGMNKELSDYEEKTKSLQTLIDDMKNEASVSNQLFKIVTSMDKATDTNDIQSIEKSSSSELQEELNRFRKELTNKDATCQMLDKEIVRLRSIIECYGEIFILYFEKINFTLTMLCFRSFGR